MEFREDGWKWGLGAALVIVAGVGIGYVSHERAQIRQLAATNESLTGSLSQVQTQLQAIRTQIAERPAPISATPSPATRTTASRSPSGPTTQPRPARAA